MNEQTPDLAGAIVQFLESLPKTISGHILLFVLMYAENEDIFTADEPLSRLRATLLQENDLKRMGAILRTIAALDHILWRTVATAPLTKIVSERVASEAPSKEIAGLLAGEPLRAKHFERALADWDRLRSNLITRENLVAYEHTRSGPPNREQPNTTPPGQ